MCSLTKDCSVLMSAPSFSLLTPTTGRFPYFVYLGDKCDHTGAAEVRTWWVHLATSPFASITCELNNSLISSDPHQSFWGERRKLMGNGTPFRLLPSSLYPCSLLVPASPHPLRSQWLQGSSADFPVSDFPSVRRITTGFPSTSLLKNLQWHSTALEGKSKALAASILDTLISHCIAGRRIQHTPCMFQALCFS